MVRMDECVEALYNKESMENKSKTMSIIKVMKGAISVSKSKTGECIFRHNKLEKRKLDRTIKKFKSDKNYVISRFDTKKKFVVSRWRTMLEKQTTCNSTRLLGELLCNKEESDLKPEVKDECDDESYFKKFLQLRLQRKEFGANGVGLLHLQKHNKGDDDAANTAENEAQDEVYVTEKKDIRRKYSLGYRSDDLNVPKQESFKAPDKTVSARRQIRLPSLPHISPIRRSQTVVPKADDGDKSQETPELERDLTNWCDWRLNDKDWLLDYIKRQKTRHEDLIMRNALAKIEAEMSGSNTIRRHQIRARLHWEEPAESKVKIKPELGPRRETMDVEHKTIPKRSPRKSGETKSENFLRIRSMSSGEDTHIEKPRKLHQEMTRVSMRSLPEPLPMILENPSGSKTTAILPLITVTKA